MTVVVKFITSQFFEMDINKKISYEDDFSDSNSTIIDFETTNSDAIQPGSLNDFAKKHFDKSNEDELESILRKYSKPELKTSPTELPKVPYSYEEPIQLSSDDELLQVFSSIHSKEVDKKYDFESNFDSDEDVLQSNPDINFQQNEYVNNDKEVTKNTHKSKKAGNNSKADKEQKKQEKAKKQQEAARQKQIKQALSAANKNMRPENCMKFITVTLDNGIINEKYGGEILNALQGLEITYKFASQLIPNTITWTRKSVHQSIEDDELIGAPEDTDVNEALLIMHWKEIINMISEETLLAHIESVKSVLNKSKLFILIYEMENYFKYIKREKQKEIKNSISRNGYKGANKSDKSYEDVPKLNKKQFETSLTELQILHSCCHQFIETPKDMAEMVAHFTKSVALVPYKLEKYQKEKQTDWFMAEDNRDCVKVDKNGNGLKRLWQQQLTTFPLARLEHAEAILAKYPTFRSLLEECNNSSFEETGLQDLPIRRAAGPLTTARRIGPELSKKIYSYFTSLEGEQLI